jgi:hypothetical protein
VIAGAVTLSLAVGGLISSPGVGRAATTFTVTSTANSGPGTFRQAIQDANATPGQDTVNFALPVPSTITLTNNVTITDDLRIEGPGRAALTLTNPASRVIDVNAGSLYIDSLAIDGAGANAIIVTSPAGAIVLDDLIISDSADHALNVVSASSVTVTNSDLTNARTPGFKGDGIHAESVSSTILIQDVVASGNEDNIEISNVGGAVTLRRVTSTSAIDEAADFQNIGGLVIESSVFDANHDQVDIIGVSGSVTISDTTVSGTEIDDGLEISDVAGAALVARSTMSGNGQAGIWVSGGATPTSVTVINSTLSGNTTSGVVATTGATVDIRHSTITGNGNHGINVLGATVNTTHTILTGNAEKAVHVVAGTATVEYSLVPTGSGVAGTGNVSSDDAKLGLLTDNGGPTQTHMPLTGSPAIEAGNVAIVSPPAVDQRGSARVVARIDIGSVETPAAPPPNRGSISILPPTVSVAESVGTVPLTVTRTGGSDGAVSVLVTTQNLSAAAPADYVDLSQVVSFANGVAGSQTVHLTINDDAKDEGEESLKVRLSQPTDGVAIGSSESVVTILDNDDSVPPPPNPEIDAAARFIPLPPDRLFDTRPAEPAAGPKGKLGTGQTIDVQVTGVAGVPANATAVVMNVTMTESGGAGFVTVWATGSAQPLTSNLNFLQPNLTRPNLITVPIGAGGKVSLYASAPTHLLADVSGYYVDTDAAVADGRLVSITPSRVFDTRPGEPAAGPKGLVQGGAAIDVQIAGEGGLPTTGMSSVVMNLTATETVADGFVTAYPTNVPRPTASVLNTSPQGPAVANLVIVPLGPDGKVRLYTSSTTHLLADVMGFFTNSAAPVSTDGLFVPLAPNRVFDSRLEEVAPGPKGFVGARSSVDFVAAGVGGVPANAAAVYFNITATQSAGPNFVTGWPTGLPRPLASSLNLETGDTRPNASILAPRTNDKVSLYTLAGAHLLADVFGYYLG